MGVPSSASPKTVLLRYLSSSTCQSRDELVLAVIGQGQRNAAHVRCGALRAGIAWDLIFICINLYQVYWLVKDRMSLRLPESDRELLSSVFKGLDDAQIAIW
jgi:hypothetical protein